MSVIQTSSAADLAAVIGDAARSGTQVRAVGGGTHGAAVDPGDGYRVSQGDRMRGVLGYVPAELVITVDAGLGVVELDAILAEHGQEWVADLVPGSTVGGTIASGASSLRRLAIGPLRDSVLGLELVDGRGRVIRVGGRTVKNSTGLDLVRLMVGSRGTLGVITRAHLRVRPRPRHRAVVLATGIDLPAALAVARQASVTAAVLAEGTSVRFLLEGWRDDVASDAAMLAERLGGEVDGREEHFGAIPPWASWPAVAMLTVRPSALEMLVSRSGGRWAALLFTGHAWVGGDSVADLVSASRIAVETGGHATLISEPGWPGWWGPAASGDASDIGARVKAAFDPSGVFPSLARWSPA